MVKCSPKIVVFYLYKKNPSIIHPLSSIKYDIYMQDYLIYIYCIILFLFSIFLNIIFKSFILENYKTIQHFNISFNILSHTMFAIKNQLKKKESSCRVSFLFFSNANEQIESKPNQSSAVQCSAVQCSAVQCSAVQCSAVSTRSSVSSSKKLLIQIIFPATYITLRVSELKVLKIDHAKMWQRENWCVTAMSLCMSWQKLVLFSFHPSHPSPPPPCGFQGEWNITTGQKCTAQ